MERARRERTESLVRFGSDGQRVQYRDADEAMRALPTHAGGAVLRAALVWSTSPTFSTPDQREANAAFIVEACSNYERVCAERDELAKSAT
jgi:hypothetical protein